MLRVARSQPIAWLILGVLAGLVIGGFWPSSPLHAVATDRYENFAMATGPLDNDVEALYFLDSVTGDLTAAVLSTQSGRFNSFYQYNILNDLGVDPSSNPRYLMVTGVADLRRGRARFRPAAAVVYVAELTTGKVGAYAIPWAPERHNAGAPFYGSFVRLHVTQFRAATIREQM